MCITISNKKMNINSHLNHTEKDWHYDGEECGHQKWNLRNKRVVGKHQSPINIGLEKNIYKLFLQKYNYF